MSASYLAEGYAKQINNLRLSFKDNSLVVFVELAHLIPVSYGCHFPKGGAIEADQFFQSYVSSSRFQLSR